MSAGARGNNNGTRAGGEQAITRQEIRALQTAVRGIPSKVPKGPAPGPDDAIVVVGITQAAHGFAVGTIVYATAGGWVKAQSNAVIAGQYAGMVSTVTDANTFNLTLAGIVSGLSALSQGVTYFLSDAAAGTAVVVGSLGADALRIPVFVAVSTTQAYLFAASAIASDLTRLTLGHKTLGGGTLKVHFAADKYLELSATGVLTLFHTTALKVEIDANCKLTITYANTNTVTINSADIVGTSRDIKLREIDVCESGVAKKMLMLASAAYT